MDSGHRPTPSGLATKPLVYAYTCACMGGGGGAGDMYYGCTNAYIHETAIGHGVVSILLFLGSRHADV